jgi:excisionase family DNA binding protein
MTQTYTAISPQALVTLLRPSRFRYFRPKASNSPKPKQRRLTTDDLNAHDRALVPVVLTVPEACAVLKISRWTLYQLIRTRQLETIKMGSRRCVPVSAIQALVERLRAEEAA